MSTQNQEFREKANCPDWGQNDLALAIARTLNLVSGKWKTHILGQLILGPVRYNKLNRLLPQISSKVLTQQLQALERDALIYRDYHSTMGMHVNYAITALGARLWNSLVLIGTSREDPGGRGTFESILNGRDMTDDRRSVKIVQAPRDDLLFNPGKASIPIQRSGGHSSVPIGVESGSSQS